MLLLVATQMIITDKVSCINMCYIQITIMLSTRILNNALAFKMCLVLDFIYRPKTIILTCNMQVTKYLLCNLDANLRHFFSRWQKWQGVTLDVFSKFGLKLNFFKMLYTCWKDVIECLDLIFLNFSGLSF